jgi:hypothetical protein
MINNYKVGCIPVLTTTGDNTASDSSYTRRSTPRVWYKNMTVFVHVISFAWRWPEAHFGYTFRMGRDVVWACALILCSDAGCLYSVNNFNASGYRYNWVPENLNTWHFAIKFSISKNISFSYWIMIFMNHWHNCKKWTHNAEPCGLPWFMFNRTFQLAARNPHAALQLVL